MMTAAQWKENTSKILKHRNNPLITDVDILLAEYHRPGKTNVQKLKVLILIRQYCRQWINEKSDKSNSFRRGHVTALLQQTEDAFRSATMQGAIQARRAGGGHAMAGKQLEESMVEVLQPRGTAKNKFGLQGNLNFTRASGPMIEQEMDNWNMVSADTVDHTDLLATLDFIQDAKGRDKLTRNLVYLQSRERLAYRVQIWPDGCFHRAGQDHIHESPANEREMYAMDEMENLYTANQPAKGGTFHHSSFLSGKPVLCAGELEIRNGNLTHVDSGSGHYKPTTLQLVHCLEVLQQKFGVNLNQATIMDFSQPQGGWQNAAQFLALRGAPMPQKPAHLRN